MNMYCVNCGVKILLASAKFCGSCGGKISDVSVDGNSSNQHDESKQKVDNKQGDYEDFLSLHAAKQAERKSFSKYRPKKLMTKIYQPDEKIVVGRMDEKMRPVSGSRLFVSIPKTADAEQIFEAAVKRFAAHDKSFDSNKQWFLAYPEGSVVCTLPESGGNFRLDSYRQELLNDYQRVTLFLCPNG